MCDKCVKRIKNTGFKGMTYGQIKARAQSFRKHGIVGVYWSDDYPRVNTAIEAHLHKIIEARTNKRYKRSRLIDSQL